MFDGPGGGGLMQTETGQMTSAAIEAGTAAEELDLMLKNLMDNLSPLSVAWTGMAGTNFQNVKLAVEENMRTLYRALTSIADDMGVSSNEYAVSDEEIAADMAAVGNMDVGEIGRLLDSDTTEISQQVAGAGSVSDLNSGQISQAMNTA